MDTFIRWGEYNWLTIVKDSRNLKRQLKVRTDTRLFLIGCMKMLEQLLSIDYIDIRYHKTEWQYIYEYTHTHTHIK